MRSPYPVVAVLTVAAISASAQSHPSWWNWASPDATALVGVRWDAVRASPMASALAEELGPGGDLGMPNLDCLRQSKQLLLSSPAFLVVASGEFSLDELRAQAAAQSMKPYTYKGVDLWISPGKDTLSVARISDHILLLGFRRVLEGAIDRNQAPGDRHYSPLLKKGARFSGEDLWVVASQLPDPLAERFVPLDLEARGFEGAVNLTDGIRLEGTLSAGSSDDAALMAAKLQHTLPGLPTIARGLQVVQAGDMVVLTLSASREQLAASLRAPSSAETTRVAEKPMPPPPAPVHPTATPAPAPAPIAAAVAEVPSAAATAPAPIHPPAPPQPRVIRIFGLDDGPREISLPPGGH